MHDFLTVALYVAAGLLGTTIAALAVMFGEAPLRCRCPGERCEGNCNAATRP
jgi:hypothetical protein